MTHSPHPLRNLLPPAISSCTRIGWHKFLFLHVKSDLFKGIFPNNILSLWNSLPIILLSAPSLASFRQALEHYDFGSFQRGLGLCTRLQLFIIIIFKYDKVFLVGFCEIAYLTSPFFNFPIWAKSFKCENFI